MDFLIFPKNVIRIHMTSQNFLYNAPVEKISNKSNHKNQNLNPSSVSTIFFAMFSLFVTFVSMLTLPNCFVSRTTRKRRFGLPSSLCLLYSFGSWKYFHTSLVEQVVYVMSCLGLHHIGLFHRNYSSLQCLGIRKGRGKTYRAIFFWGGKRTVKCPLQNQFWRPQKLGFVWTGPVSYKEHDRA